MVAENSFSAFIIFLYCGVSQQWGLWGGSRWLCSATLLHHTMSCKRLVQADSWGQRFSQFSCALLPGECGKLLTHYPKADTLKREETKKRKSKFLQCFQRTKEVETVTSIWQHPGASWVKCRMTTVSTVKVFLALEILLVITEGDSLEGRVSLYLIHCVPRDVCSVPSFKKNSEDMPRQTWTREVKCTL